MAALTRRLCCIIPADRGVESRDRGLGLTPHPAPGAVQGPEESSRLHAADRTGSV